MPDPINTIKNISELVKKYNDLPLMQQIVDLQTEVFELQRENLALKKQVDEREKMSMRQPHGYYFKAGDDVPFCPKCWENDSKAIHLPAEDDYAGGHGRVCRVCKQLYVERKKEGGGRRQIPGTPWG